MRSLTAPLAQCSEYNQILDALSQSPDESGRMPSVMAEGCQSSQMLHMMYALTREERLAAHARLRLIITWSEKRAREIQEEYSFYDRNTSLFPAKDLIFYQADLRGREIETQRIRCLRRIMEGRPLTMVTTFSALMTPQIPIESLKGSLLTIARHGMLSEETIAERLVAMGYEKTHQVEGPGQFSIRGDIVDIFDLTEDNPYRIELFDDEVDSIRSFDISSQRSIEQLSEVSVYPATEMIISRTRLDDGFERIRSECARTVDVLRGQHNMEAASRLGDEMSSLEENARTWNDYTRLEGYIHYFYPRTDSILSIFDENRTIVLLDEPQHIREHAEATWKEFRESMTGRVEKGYVLPGQMELLRTPQEILSMMSRYRRLSMALLAGSGAEEFADASFSTVMKVRAVAPYNRSFEALEKDLKSFRLQKFRVVIISASRTRAKRLAQDLTERGLTTFYSENPDRVLEPGEIMTYYGHVSQGFEYVGLGFVVIAETDIFGAQRVRKKKKKYSGESIQNFADLKPGDYVVHEDHGIGIYRGVEKIEVDHIAKDYIRIEYGGGGTLFILPTEMNVLQKYSAAGEVKPKLNKLGTQEWTNTRAKVSSAVEEVAQDLVELYAKRQALKGHAFGEDTVWQKEFEEMFPYEETEDQLTAIEDTKRDMESSRIMDRLICGDVGFGKTEIAIRAAFKAVQDGFQVAVLVPTTILAQQHFNTFQERMKEYPVNIGMLSRFRSDAENRKTIEGLKSGRIDIVVGTHKLLAKNVLFKALGLLIVDEEQRFGVSHKEKIKKLKENVDVLTLTATPIPRTLHMSLVGIRDMSVLEQAPQDRMPVQTYVMEYDEEMVREAIVRELSRKGQVYYVYNRVNDIDDVAARVQKMVPEARVASAHGQMAEAELEKIMFDFIRGEIDVLVSTTIIETGLDIPNVNTIIIHDSDRMGLSQLYQLRGRVGRASRSSYAFLMYRKDKMLKEVAEKRLSAIREFTELGSGFRIAMRDLEIRGAGSVLGRAQHGHMAAVGYDLYCKLLDMAVRKAKGTAAPKEKNVTVNLSADAFIPAGYIPNEVQKLDIYKKISSVASLEDCDDVRDELRDRFGEKIPAPAENLLRIALIRAVAGRLDIAEITGGDGLVRVVMAKDANILVGNIPRLLKQSKNKLQFFPKGAAKGEHAGWPYFNMEYEMTGILVRDEEILLQSIENLLVDIASTLR